MRLRNGAERKLPTDIWLNSQFSAYSTPACDGRAIMTRNESKMTLTISRRALIRTAAWALAPLAASMAVAVPAAAQTSNTLAAVQQHLRSTASMVADRSEEHTSELQSLMRISYAVFCLNKKRERKADGSAY